MKLQFTPEAKQTSVPTPLNGEPKDTGSSSSSSTARYTSAGPAGVLRLGKVQVLERGENMFAPWASLSGDEELHISHPTLWKYSNMHGNLVMEFDVVVFKFP